MIYSEMLKHKAAQLLKWIASILDFRQHVTDAFSFKLSLD